ncbi:MAG: Dipeptidyl aminopeptidase/acylaminoacyl peptidase, partial [Bacteroidetes bacterium]|nr:Dipeptidyl aminopeptidase/acylaminoacyl peptidase [Bacteroidota bacterium]
ARGAAEDLFWEFMIANIERNSFIFKELLLFPLLCKFSTRYFYTISPPGIDQFIVKELIMRRLFGVIALCAAVWMPADAQKKPFAIADIYRLAAVEDPRFSPDGKQIAFVVRESNLKEGTTNNEIYMIRADGTDLRRMTNNPASDMHPRWSPDGSSLLFVSTRSNGQQTWLLPVNGGEPRQLTDFSAGTGDPVWSPDGKLIAFSSDVYPDCGALDSCNKAISARAEEGPLQAYMADSLLYRHWTSWKEGKRTHILTYRLDSKTYMDLTPGDFDAPAFALGGTGFAYAPDGRELCYVANRDRYEAENTNKDLWLVSSEGGVAQNITAGNTAFDGDPIFSPDGKYIAYRTQTLPRYEADRFRLALFDRQTRQTRILTESFDNWVNDMQWSADSKHLYFTADEKGHVPLYRLDIRSGAITLVIDVKTIDAFSISPDGSRIALVRRSVGEPQELWTCDAAGNNLRRVTTFNRAVEEEVDIRPAEELWIPSPTGRRIHTFVVKPHNFQPGKKYPLILNVHGGPQMQWTDSFRGDWQVYPGSGYIVAFPNPHGSTGYGQEFTAAISGDWGGKVYQDLMAVTDSLARLPYVDADRVGAMGWSYGGYMMMWMEGHTDRFKALAAMMGVYNLKAMHGGTEELWFPEYDLGGTPWESELYTTWSPNRFVKEFKTPCLVITGERDYRVPYTCRDAGYHRG